ncbi:GNAT family N-acetyltransferase [Mycetocola spongiae]|uniref:GNAT family N-acetyltransferase n=1 Tax=Mycetocola spongiae TaxID=2859226 RepID=UPI001CF50CE2|nr:GNAT family N-acetyltransferase [Mycetocola spongiae]UCR89851.1 N-acetyltransferase [Mycetocola spongiae]
MTETFANETGRGRYTLHTGGVLAATLAYTVRENTVFFTYSFTDPAYRGRGLAARLVEFATADVAADPARRIVPTCGYVRGWFAEHPEHAGLLAEA